MNEQTDITRDLINSFYAVALLGKYSQLYSLAMSITSVTFGRLLFSPLLVCVFISR